MRVWSVIFTYFLKLLTKVFSKTLLIVKIHEIHEYIISSFFHLNNVDSNISGSLVTKLSSNHEYVRFDPWPCSVS